MRVKNTCDVLRALRQMRRLFAQREERGAAREPHLSLGRGRGEQESASDDGNRPHAVAAVLGPGNRRRLAFIITSLLSGAQQHPDWNPINFAQQPSVASTPPDGTNAGLARTIGKRRGRTRSCVTSSKSSARGPLALPGIGRDREGSSQRCRVRVSQSIWSWQRLNGLVIAPPAQSARNRGSRIRGHDLHRSLRARAGGSPVHSPARSRSRSPEWR